MAANGEQVRIYRNGARITGDAASGGAGADGAHVELRQGAAADAEMLGALRGRCSGPITAAVWRALAQADVVAIGPDRDAPARGAPSGLVRDDSRFAS